jgi:hypothetical protein
VVHLLLDGLHRRRCEHGRVVEDRIRQRVEVCEGGFGRLVHIHGQAWEGRLYAWLEVVELVELLATAVLEREHCDGMILNSKRLHEVEDDVKGTGLRGFCQAYGPAVSFTGFARGRELCQMSRRGPVF